MLLEIWNIAFKPSAQFLFRVSIYWNHTGFSSLGNVRYHGYRNVKITKILLLLRINQSSTVVCRRIYHFWGANVMEFNYEGIPWNIRRYITVQHWLFRFYHKTFTFNSFLSMLCACIKQRRNSNNVKTWRYLRSGDVKHATRPKQWFYGAIDHFFLFFVCGGEIASHIRIKY